MPNNLNALIRYKTINSCLYGVKRRWSIQELIDRCSEALAEYRGRYERISERTVRDDIRVMRSEILGYNAPIKQYKGQYFYSDPAYSITTISFTDSELIGRIIGFLFEIKKEISHPELEILLEKLIKMKIKYGPVEPLIEMPEFSLESAELSEYFSETESPEILKETSKHRPTKIFDRRKIYKSEPIQSGTPVPSIAELNWSNILDILK